MRPGKRSGARAIGGAACAMFLLAAPGPAQGTRGTTTACTSFDIGTETPLRDAQRRRMYLDMPAGVAVQNGFALFATQTRLWRSEKIFVDTAGMIDEAKAGKAIDMDTLAGVLLDRAGIASLVGLPRGLGRVQSVVAAPDGNGGAWAAWLTGPDATSPPTDAWIGHYRNQRWDTAEAVGHFRHILPSSLTISGANRGAPPVIALSGAITGISGVAILRRSGAGWKPTWFKDVWPPLHVEIARQNSHRLTAAFLGSSAPPRADADSNSVWILQSADDGQTWSSPRAIDRNWNGNANWPQLRVADSLTLHLTWMVDRQEQPGSRIVHAASHDGGATWRRDTEQSHPALRALASMATARGLTYITQEREADKLALVDLRSNASPAVLPLRWPNTALPFSATTAGEPSGPVLVTWGTTVAGAYPMFPIVDAPATSYAWLTPCR